MKQYHASNAQTFPEYLVIYRDGVSETRSSELEQVEIRGIQGEYV